jgi:hypothetical protein
VKNIRLRGTSVPFHAKKVLRTKSTFQPSPDSIEMMSLAQKMSPTHLRPSDIRMLIQDLGRNSLHTMMSDASDSLAAVRQMKKQWTEKFKAGNSDVNADQESESNSFVLCELSYVQLSWKLKLDVLEMIAEAQNSLMYYGRK